MQEAKMTKETEEKNVKPKEEEYTLVKVATQHELAVETPEGDYVSTEQAIVMLLNKVARLERALIGK